MITRKDIKGVYHICFRGDTPGSVLREAADWIEKKLEPVNVAWSGIMQGGEGYYFHLYYFNTKAAKFSEFPGD